MSKPRFSVQKIVILIAVTAIAVGLGFRSKEMENIELQHDGSGYIVFTSTQGSNYEIYSMKPDGSGLFRLTDNPAHDYNPSISPDGQKIAFTSNRDSNMNGNYEIYIMDFDGSNQVRITDSASGDIFPAWSPDGTRIAYTSVPMGGTPDIYVMNVDGSEQINITNDPGYDWAPAWSPDGTQIAFVSSRDEDNLIDPISRLYIMDADGTNPQRLIDFEVRWPAWSPDGTKIAFVSYENGSGELHVFDLISQVDTVLVTELTVDGKVAWSPYGQEILFSSYMDNVHSELYRVNITSLDIAQITSGDVFNGDADWKDVISSLPIPTSEIEGTATAETVLTPAIIETALPTEPLEIVPTETFEPPTASPEVEDTATTEATLPPTIIETLTFTDIPETELIETP